MTAIHYDVVYFLEFIFLLVFEGAVAINDSIDVESHVSRNATDNDKIICGDCSAGFLLADTLLFIKHKREGCGSDGGAISSDTDSQTEVNARCNNGKFRSNTQYRDS